ncbi:MAG: FtsK/SpoIIIE domain-containing protein [Actinomycetota bacterium]
MELLLRLREGGTHVDVVVETPANEPVTHIAHQLADRFGVSCSAATLEVLRSGAVLHPDEAIGAAGVVSGDEVAIVQWTGDRAGESTIGGVSLLVRTGPRAGDRVDVRRRLVLGRDADADVSIADPLVSRRHVEIEPTSHGSLLVRDLGSSHGTLVNSQVVSGSVEVASGDVISIGATECEVQASSKVEQGSTRHRNGAVDFSRPPRIAPEPVQREVRFPVPPEEIASRRFPIVATLAPLVLAGAMAYFVGPIMLVFALVSPIMMIANRWEDKRTGRSDLEEAIEAYAEGVQEAVESATHSYETLLARRLSAQPDVRSLVSFAATLDPRLWERRAEDKDFLHLRVGTRDQQSSLSVVGGPRADDERAFAVSANEFIASVLVDPNAPFLVDLMNTPGLGLIGDRNSRNDLLNWLVAQAACQCSPNDLALCVVAPDRPEWGWTRWLPHTRTLGLDGPFARSVALDSDDARALIARIESVLDERQRRLRAKAGMETAEDILPRILLVVPDGDRMPDASLTHFLRTGRELGLSTIVGGESVERLTGEVRTIVDVSSGCATDTRSGSSSCEITIEGLDSTRASNVARSLAPLRDVTQKSGTGEIPASVLLLDLLDVNDPAADDLRRRWDSAPSSLGADIGLTSSGVYHLDLRRHGPHGLVAGTTGSGKSELLQTIVAALAATHSPTRLNFILIDYKGGAAFKDCVDLPHPVGFFTDLDAHLALRALTSLNAELKRREHVLAEFAAKDIVELESIRPDKAPANLLIIIDEFAFLKRTVPEFVAGVVDIAQRGRSLGVHLILATQRPSGIVDENVRANTNLRIALRVADERDSEDVIDRRDAVDLPKSLPGRAYIKTGPTSIELVQTAYSNARRDVSDVADVVIESFDSVLRVRPRRTAVPSTSSDAATDLQKLVAAVEAAWIGRPAQPRPWLDPLPDIVDAAELNVARSGCAAALALADRPTQQSQDPWICDLGSNGHLLVFGASGSGKSTAMRTLAGQLASTMSPEDVHLYVLDFGSRALGSLAHLPHCGGVFTPEQPELVERTFSRLDKIVAERREAMGRLGVTTIDEARRAGLNFPYVVTMIDGYATFNSTYQLVDHGEMNDRLIRLLSDGRSVGVMFVLSADRRNAVPTAVSSLVPQRLVLRMGEIDEYISLGLSGDLGRTVLPAGRGFLQDATELHVAIFGSDASGSAQSEAIRGIAQRSSTHGSPEPVRELASSVDVSELAAVMGRVRLGIEGESGNTVALDLLSSPHIAVIGPERSGRTTTLATLVSDLGAFGRPVRTFLAAPRRTELTDLGDWEEIGRGTDGCDAMLVQLAAEVRERSGDESDLIVVVVDDGEELADGASSSSLSEIMRRGRDVGVIVLAAVSTTAAHRSFGGWISDLKRTRHAVLLMPDVDVDGDLVSVRLPRKSTRRFVQGRGYFVNRGDIAFVQVAQSR